MVVLVLFDLFEFTPEALNIYICGDARASKLMIASYLAKLV